MIVSVKLPDAAPDSALDRRLKKLVVLFEELLDEITQPKFYGKVNLIVSARDGIPELAELETKDQIKLT